MDELPSAAELRDGLRRTITVLRQEREILLTALRQAGDDTAAYGHMEETLRVCCLVKPEEAHADDCYIKIALASVEKNKNP